MCGRYTLSTSGEVIRDHFDLPAVPELESRFNISPSQEAPIVGARQDGARAAGMARWGLASRTTARAGIKPLINARIETVDRKPAFRDAFSRRRCLVPADGFYEWQAGPNGKIPHFFSLRDGEPFAFAGIWNQPLTDADQVTFAILTTRPNAVVQPVHARMPVILKPATYDEWLARQEIPADRLEAIAVPFPAVDMQVWQVSTLVNSPANDNVKCVEAAPVC